MAEAGITEATLVINNTVCEGPYGCDTLVPMPLPENSVLTVHEVTDAGVTTKKYRGGAKPTWRWKSGGTATPSSRRASSRPTSCWHCSTGGRRTVDYPIMFEVLDADDPYQGSILHVGLVGEMGALYFSGPQAERGCYTYSEASGQEDDVAKELYFDHMNHTRDFPPTSLYPIDVIRRAVVEFVNSNGSLPGVVAWQPASVMSSDAEA